MAAARAKAGEDANPYAIAAVVMAAHREKYERMSILTPLMPLPRLSADASGLRFEVALDGHSVIHLRLE
jgi:hypothetical protein